MLPVPMVADSAVHSAWNWEMEVLSRLCRMSCFLNREPIVSFQVWPNRVNWKPFVRKVIRNPVPIRRISAGTPQTTLLILSLTVLSTSTKDMEKRPLYEKYGSSRSRTGAESSHEKRQNHGRTNLSCAFGTSFPLCPFA